MAGRERRHVTDQLSLTDIVLGGRRSIDDRFQQFHADHPEVYDEIVFLARELKVAGHKRVGMKLIFEVVRWRRLLRGVPDSEGFKLNNVYSSRYSRLVMEQEPDLAGFFETRELQSA